MKMGMIMIPLLEMVDSSKESVIRELNKNETSPNYEQDIEGIEDDVLRFDFPYDYSQRLGVCSPVYLWTENDGLIFSMFQPIEEIQFLSLKPFLWKENGFPRTIDLNQEDDSNFFIIPNYVTEELKMNAGDPIEYQWIEQDFIDNDQERQVRCIKIDNQKQFEKELLSDKGLADNLNKIARSMEFRL